METTRGEKMAFTRITNAELNSRGATTLPNQPTISASALKQEFDAPAKNVVAPKVNNLMDELEAGTAAASIGAVAPTGRTGATVQAIMNDISSDLTTVEGQIGEAIADAHTHSNKALLDTYSQTEADIAQAIADDHTHTNKALLDTYEQTEANIADAVSKKHEHSNKSLLDSYSQSESDLADAVSKKHSHSNKDLLDTYTQTESDIADAVDKKHSHSNKALLDTYKQTDTDIADAVTKKHSHLNKSVLDKFSEVSGDPYYDGNPIGGGGAVNNAFKYVKAKGTTITASGEDLLELKAGSNVDFVVDATEKSITISSSGGGGSSTGDMLASDYDSDYNVKNAGGIAGYIASLDYIAKSSTSGLVKNDGTIDTNTYVTDISGKADKVSSATSGNFAGLDSNGNPTDSGKKASDFMASNAGIGDLSNVTITSAATDDVLKYDGSKWVNGQGSGGTTVVANPSGTATDTLTKLQVGSTIYSVEGGGGTTIVQIPSVVGDTFTYNGISQGPTITGLDSTHCTVTGATAVNAGTYTLTIALNDPSTMVWSDLTNADKTYSFTIAKAPQTLTASKASVSLDMQTPSDTVTISGQQTSLNVSSSASGVATASESSGVVTITAVGNGSAIVSVYAEETANYTQSNTVNISVNVIIYTIFGFHINGDESNPSSAVTYIQGCDNYGYTPAYMNYSTGQFDYGSWNPNGANADAVAFIFPRPCMLKSDGTVDYYLSESDYTKKADGVTASDVANTSSDGNAMMEWGRNGKKIWYKVVPDSNSTKSASIYIANEKIDNDYHAWSFVNNTGDLVDHFYTAIYNGSSISSKIRSLSGQAMAKTLPYTTERNYAQANNPTGKSMWDTMLFCDRQLINFLLILMGKSLNTQAVYGMGAVNGGSSQTVNDSFRTGIHNNRGLFYGTNDGTVAVNSYANVVKVFGMENWWGMQRHRMTGIINNNGAIKIKYTHGTQDGSSATDYNATGADYLSIASATPTGTTANYTTEMVFDSSGAMLNKVSSASGSDSTYYTDGLSFLNSVVSIPFYGGSSNVQGRGGALMLEYTEPYNSGGWNYGTDISCKPSS